MNEKEKQTGEEVSSDYFTVRLGENLVARLTGDVAFDGVAIADEIREGISLLLEIRGDDPDFRGRVGMAYKKARTLLSELPLGQEIIEALGFPLEDYYDQHNGGR